MPHASEPPSGPPEIRLQGFVEKALQTAKTARRHHLSLAGLNFYGDKLANLRAEASICFQDLSDPSVGDLSTMAEMIEKVFSAATDYKSRVGVSRELLYELKTKKWRTPSGALAALGIEDAVFPLSLLSKTRRSYLLTVGRQMNGCFASGWYDACAVMMRRLVETCIIEAFEGNNIAANIKNAQGDFLDLSELIQKTLSERAWNLSRNAKSALPRLRDIGHIAAHSRRFTAQKSDIAKVSQDCRIAVEELLHLAGLI